MQAHADRLIAVLDFKGIKGRGVYSRVARDTGYTHTQVAAFLKGTKPVSDRFVKIFCATYDIRESFIYGEEDNVQTPEPMRATSMSTPEVEMAMKHLIAEWDTSSPAASWQWFIAAASNKVCLEGLHELYKMPEPKRWRAVGVLKEMNEE